MDIQRYLARQLSKPTGITGKFILGRLWNRRNSKLNDLTLALLAPQEHDRILDIGFGGGYLLDKILPALSDGLATGVDISPIMVENYRQRRRHEIAVGRLELHCASAENLPFPYAYFTKVSSVNSLFYWSDVQHGITEIYRVLCSGGKCILTFTCKQDLEKKGFTRYGLKTFEELEIRQFLANIGFNQIETRAGEDRHRAFICMIGTR